MTTTTVQELLHAKGHHLWSVTPDGCAHGDLMPWRLQQLGLNPGYWKLCCTSLYQDLERVCASCKSCGSVRETLPEATLSRVCDATALTRRLSMHWLLIGSHKPRRTLLPKGSGAEPVRVIRH